MLQVKRGKFFNKKVEKRNKKEGIPLSTKKKKKQKRRDTSFNKGDFQHFFIY